MSIKLFLYYAVHSVKNQIRKLLKTWVLIFFLACVLIGGLVGVMAGTATDMIDDGTGYETEDETYSDDEYDEDEIPADISVVPGEGTEEDIITGSAMLELVSGGLILLILFFFMIGADESGAKIFQMADVNLLFTSPLTPSSVLMFRVLTRMGMMLFITIYMLLELPNMILNLGLTAWTSVVILFAWFCLMVYSSLIQTFLYLAASAKPIVKKFLRPVIYGVILAIAAAFMVTAAGSGSYLVSAIKFFNAPVSRWIPIWGWTKGMIMFYTEGEYPKAAICLCLVILGAAVLLFAIRHVRADFYEDAMAKSEEMEEMRSRAKENPTGIAFRKRKKDRAESIGRDEFHHGYGANVFFFKAMHNRFRFAHFHIFTKTMETYLVAAIGTGLFLRLFWGVTGETAVITIVLELAAISFFRALGNSIEEDTSISWFAMIPESTTRKLAWSLLGSLTNCALDMLLPVILGTLIVGGNLGFAFEWSLVALSVFTYSTVIGLFIGLSVPRNAGKNIKQMVQIMFVYFGLIPDAAIIAFGFILGFGSQSGVLVVVINLLLSCLFFALCPGCISPRPGKRQRVRFYNGDLKQAKKVFSWLAFTTAAMFLITYAVQFLISVLISILAPVLFDNSWTSWLLSFVPLYFIALPIGMLMMHHLPKSAPEKHSLRWTAVPTAFLISVFLMYSGNIIGLGVNALLGRIIGMTVENNLTDYVMDSNIIAKIGYMVILAPCLEELVFRKQLIDRTRIYGEKPAILMSALLFGMFHGNLYQFFYAFLIGLVFGYVYVRSGKLRYSIGMHMTINFIGGIVSSLLLENVDLEALENMSTAQLFQNGIPAWMIGYFVFLLCIVVCWLVGLVLFIIKVRTLHFEPGPEEIPYGTAFKTAVLNVGMLCMLVMFILGTSLSILL